MNAPPPSLPRRHPLVSLAVLAVVLAALWVGWFLASFDLNDYRTSLASGLEQQLHLPVQLGEARLRLRRGGIALRFAGLQIGSAQASDELQAESLWLQLSWRGLLLGRPEFAAISVDDPVLRMDLPAPAAPSSSPAGTIPGAAASPSASDEQPPLWEEFRVRRLEIRGGRLDLGWPQADGTVKRLQFSSLAGSLKNFGPERSSRLELGGELGGDAKGGSFRIDGGLDTQSASKWGETAWSLSCEGKQLDAALLAELLPQAQGGGATGRADLQLHLSGKPGGSVSAEFDLQGNRLAIRPGSAYRHNIPLARLQGNGTWQPGSAGGILHVDNLQADGLQLSGEVDYARGENGALLTGRLADITLPAAVLHRWLPPAAAEKYPALSRLQPQGRAFFRHLELLARLPSGEGPGELSVQGLDGELHGWCWDLPDSRRLRLDSVGLKLAERRWQLTGGQASVADLPLAFGGTLETGDGPPRIDLAISGNLPAAQLAALWEKKPGDLAAAGTLALQGRLSGAADSLRLTARIDLSALDVRYGEHLHLPPAPGSLASLSARLSATAMNIEQGNFSLPGVSGTATGSVEWGDAPSLKLSGSLQAPALAALRPLAPAIDRLRLDGSVAAEWTVAGPLAAPQPAASLTMRNVAIHAHGVVADISSIQGRLQLDGTRLRSGPLSARLGSSPARLWAQVDDLANPRLVLKVEAAAVRANELIFPSTRSILRDLAGGLVISAEGLDFNDINVRLDGGTRATVRGTLRNFSDPHTELDIHGSYANVEEIIALWHRDRPAGAPASPPAESGTASPPAAHRHVTRILARADEGDLYGMHFSAAAATIVPTGEFVLIHPLDFKAGEGFCTAQVLVDFRGAAPLLRISGHAENADAYVVYNQLLGRKSILRGTLRGDFHLQGELGGRGFLPTSFGQFNATISDGVLRHSPVLSTVFSLLNVSQLFSLKLPDIDSEGLPFSQLEARLHLDKGVLSSDHLVLDSEAVSMAYSGSYNLVSNRLDLLAVAKPLGTVDKIVTRLPIAGWILGGEEKALITAHFRITGGADKPEVEAIPITAMSKGVLGIFKRALGLPVKLVEDPAILWGGGGEK